MKNIATLVLMAGPVLLDLPSPDSMPEVPEVIHPILRARNGFYAFESALHGFPYGKDPNVMDIGTWNSSGLWRSAYDFANLDMVCFAEDAFGHQFCVYEQGIGQFDPEQATLEYMAGNAEEWAGMILAEYDYYTGYSLASQWQKNHGVLPPGKRLVPITPFVAGGEFHVDNLMGIDAVEGMRYRGYLAEKIRELPDGTDFQIVVVDE
jgi:hypothetical protein